MKHLRGKLRIALAVALVGVCALVISVPALGIGGSGTAWEVKRVVSWSPDKYSVKAKAYSLNADTKARGYYTVNNWPDKATVWFTALNVTYQSGESSVDGTPSLQLSGL